MITSLDCQKKVIYSILLLIASIFCVGLWYFFSPGVVHAKESPVELGPYEVIISKDPFDPERGKNENLAENDTSAEEDLKSHYQVYGTIIAGGVRLAYLKVANPKSSKPLRRAGKSGAKNLRTIVIGDIVDGWRVADITAQGVKFESDGEYVEVGMFDEVKKERKATAPVALQTPHPRPQVSRAPQSTPAKRASSSKPGSRSQIKPVKKTKQHSKTFGPAKTSTSSGPQAETGGTKGAPGQPKFFTPHASPGGQGRPNPFLELLKKAKGK